MLNKKLIAAAGTVIATAAVLAGVTTAFVGGGSNGEAHAEEPAGKALLPTPASARKVDRRATVDGQVYSVFTYRAANGQTCVGEAIPGGGEGVGCFDKAKLFAEGPIAVSYGSRQDEGNRVRFANTWVWGFAAPSISRLEIVTRNCARIPVEVGPDGVFLHVSSRAQLAGGNFPLRIEALAAEGEVIGAKDIALEQVARRSGILVPSTTGC